jgi:hypothetical protein
MENINPQVDAKEAELEAEKLRKEKVMKIEGVLTKDGDNTPSTKKLSKEKVMNIESVLTKDGENTPSTEKTVDPVGPNDPAGPLPAQEDISRGRSRIRGRSISPREDGSGSMRRFRERSPQSRLPGNMENINPQVDAKEAELEAEK